MGPRYQAIASFVRKGPARLDLNLGGGVQASFVVAEVSQPSRAPQAAPFSSFYLAGPCGNRLDLDEEQISHVQPDGPQDGTRLFIGLDSGASVTLTRAESPV